MPAVPGREGGAAQKNGREAVRPRPFAVQERFAPFGKSGPERAGIVVFSFSQTGGSERRETKWQRIALWKSITRAF
jgi:hypothetical protein